MDAATLGRISDQIHDLSDRIDLAQAEHRPWSGSVVDAYRRRTIKLIDEVLAGLRAIQPPPWQGEEHVSRSGTESRRPWSGHV